MFSYWLSKFDHQSSLIWFLFWVKVTLITQLDNCLRWAKACCVIADIFEKMVVVVVISFYQTRCKLKTKIKTILNNGGFAIELYFGQLPLTNWSYELQFLELQFTRITCKIILIQTTDNFLAINSHFLFLV